MLPNIKFVFNVGAMIMFGFKNKNIKYLSKMF